MSVSVLLPEPVKLVGLNDVVTPFAPSSEADRFTVPANPLSTVTVIVPVLLAPRSVLRRLGDAERLKLGCGGALTVKVMMVVGVKLGEAEVPLIVTVKLRVCVPLGTVSVRVLFPLLRLRPVV